ncbi:MAG: Purine nucleoside phosphoramidase [bacterium]|nr:Purine nucleoside phosphoramidase [bacterium]
MDLSCLFCRIAAGEIPADILYQDESVVAFRDIAPQAPTHLLLIPRRHVASTLDLSGDDAPLVGQLVTVATQLAQEAGFGSISEGYRLVINTGDAAGQSVHHLHLHLLGGRHLAWPPG